MRVDIIVKRYAEAYVDVIRTTIGVEACVGEMKGLKWLLRENPEFERFLKAPEVPFSEKYRVIDKTLGGHYSEDLRNFLKYLISRERIDRIIEIADYIRLTYSHADSAEVLLRTTFPLDLEVIEKIKKMLEAKIGQKVNLHLELDPDLLGGVQVTIGNKVMDGSVRHKLDALKEELLKAQVGA
ncbi:MAG: ATP synthase F1 subunit delta [Elusimicrobia bacterium]|nr:ATP synthase F1 subunit delta [Elusimicrobiota bacterium]